jgi:2-polyprenyl-3-methyl-5-hydroxy-6-metoxy-1,4-benzoquinol methylase
VSFHQQDPVGRGETERRDTTRFADRVIADLGATMAAGAVVLGDRLGLYRALAAERMRSLELARRTGTAPRYVEEWLRGQAAGGYVEYDPGTGEYWLTPEQQHALAGHEGPLGGPGAFELAVGALSALPRLESAFRTGEGLGWHEHDSQVFDGWARLQYGLYSADLVPRWLPALDGVTRKLRRGARVADVACGHAVSTILMAQAFPASRFDAFDYHVESLEVARKRVADAGLGARVRVEEAYAHCFHGGPYDLVTTFEALHDVGDPAGLARHVAGQLTPDGTWMIVEPLAGMAVAENLHALGRIYYSMSMYFCVPMALAQEGGHSLGALAGEEPIRRVVTAGGFGHFRRVAQTALTAVYEARR